MCGVIGLISERHRNDLGAVGAELLKTLEYRGYDSTGAAFQGEGESIDLRKGVGAPSVMVERLGIIALGGSIMCGQVRWATFGSVDDLNAQPHEVRCRVHMYGAHNGNVTNSDDLKVWLTSEGHTVLSDNDGEMVVHTVEHFFAAELARAGNPSESGARRACMRRAVVEAAAKLKGSYAAVVVDPVSRTVWAVKQGSSLYFGFGRDEAGGGFAIASSDLSSVLKLTRVLVPMAEGEFIEYTAGSWQLYSVGKKGSLEGGDPISRQPKRSRLQAKDAALLPQFTSFMEQEIFSQEDTCRRIATLFSGGSEASRTLAPWLDRLSPQAREEIGSEVEKLFDEYDGSRIRQRFDALQDLPVWRDLAESVPEETRLELTSAPISELRESLCSMESAVLADLIEMALSRDAAFSVRLLDAMEEREELVEFDAAATAFLEACQTAIERDGRIFFLCCGSSYHAAMAGAVFFNELARAEVVPILPGEFRGRFAKSLRPDDLVVAVSQSGETKDLIDVMNYVIATGLPIRRIAIVNNVSSTLGQEKSDTVLPLRCGPEVAVPATKSYMNQLAMMYCLALELGRSRVEKLRLDEASRAALREELTRRKAGLGDLPRLIRETLDATTGEIEEAAKLLYLRPSMHILATRLLAVAKEGALKIREVVLNHTEGYEASEFKHGPNTILGVNTVFGIDDLLRFSAAVSAALESLPALPYEAAIARDDVLATLYADYPLIFVTGPDQTDVNLTVSQVNTHKIRGTSCVMVAEENPSLRQAVMKPPAANDHYRAVYITLPKTGDNLMVIFTATVALQRLALRMSLLKKEELDRIGIREHGVHPDVPKNVSKSITVD